MEGSLWGVREALPGQQPEPAPGIAANQKGTRGYLSAGDTFRVLFSPPGWMLTSSGKLLPLLASRCLDYPGDLLHVPGTSQLQADVSQL